MKLVSQRKFEKVSRNRPCYTVQRQLKLVSQRRCTQVSAKVSTCNGGLKALLHKTIFLATFLAILLRHKLQEPLTSVTCPEMKHVSHFFFLPQQLRKIEVGCTSCNSDCNKNIARQVHYRACYTKQRFVQLGLQRRTEIVKKVTGQIA